MVKVEDGVVDPGEMVRGFNEQVRPEGAEQVSEICPLNPPTALALIITLLEPPGDTVALWAARFKEKFGPDAAAAGTTLAKTLVVLPPAGKLG